ncbi:MAG: hypothetical protein UT30_C0014G0002 [Candidatus Uhrbacteria bacterium GW2011_GWF2_39_13]|uniref:Fibronectin type-III domain-containing protein n=1 Tax=Candidatus Uhrbacteria bacterium GW2011_GWF2_39_13 TaxID=1618995 RepID=A0A0G0MIW2_9BACT|nr:MAG: hypothetical protein UT30_C0014G0002 [Candidatus Uhrbacteria bacterium GW2011_GWF2_39_13]
MATFPTKESEIYSLALRMIEGLRGNPDFPKPPISWPSLKMKSLIFRARQNDKVKADAKLTGAENLKKKALKNLIAAIKKNLRYAENTVNFDDNKLKLLGWSGHREPGCVHPPAQPTSLKARLKDGGHIELKWKKPLGQNTVSLYRLYRRILPDGKWEDIANCFNAYLLLKEQSRNCEMEFYISAVNKVGQSIPSNTVQITT